MAQIHIKEMLRASVKTILIGFVLVLIAGLLAVLGHFLDEETASIIWSILGIIGLIYIPAYFLLYLWTGYRAKRKFRLSTMEAGVTTAFTFVVIGLFSFVLNMVLILLSVEEILTYQITPAMFEIGEIFEGYYILDIALCGLGKLVIGFIINFVIGLCGAVIADEKKR